MAIVGVATGYWLKDRQILQRLTTLRPKDNTRRQRRTASSIDHDHHDTEDSSSSSFDNNDEEHSRQHEIIWTLLIHDNQKSMKRLWNEISERSLWIVKQATDSLRRSVSRADFRVGFLLRPELLLAAVFAGYAVSNDRSDSQMVRRRRIAT